MLVTLIIWHCLGHAAGGAPPTSAPQTPSSTAATEGAERAKQRYDALLAALQTYEASLTGLAWEQEVMIEPLPRGSGKRYVAFKTSFVVVPDGRWSIQSRRIHFEGNKAIETDERFLFDGKCLLAANPKGHAGVIRGHDGVELHESLLSPLMLIGGSHVERVSSPWMNRLSDKLCALSDVAVDESAAPLIRLSGSRYQGGKWERVSATLDTEHDFMPVRYTRRLELYDILREEIVTTGYEQVGTVWVPNAGTRVIYGLKPTDEAAAMPPERQEVLEKLCNERIASAGLSRDKYADRLKIAEIMRATFKIEVLQAKPLGGGRDVLRAWNLQAVTAENADETLAQPFAEGDQVADARTGKKFVYRDGKLAPLEAKEAACKP